MRSETVVLPASMWAAMPMFRTLLRSRAIGFLTSLEFRFRGRRREVFLHRSPGTLTRSRGRKLTLTTLDFGQHEPAKTARSSRGLLLETIARQISSLRSNFTECLPRKQRNRAVKGKKCTGGPNLVKCLMIGPFAQNNTPGLLGRGC